MEVSGFAKTDTDSKPTSIVSNHNTLPKSDMCNDFEYSLFLMKRESIYCVASNTTITEIRLKTMSTSSRYLKTVVITNNEAIITEIISE